MKKKIVAGAMALTLAASYLTGCASGAAKTTEAATEAATEAVTEAETEAAPEAGGFNTEQKEAEPATKKVNEALAADANYMSDYEKEKENAEFGLIDKGDGLIKDLNDPDKVYYSVTEKYDFLMTETNLGTVNPSLWDHAKLNYNYGLYKVTDGVYQVRGYDMANITFAETDNGWYVMDSGTTAEGSRAALALVNKNLGERPIMAVSYSHSHVDHYGGIRGLVDEEDVKSGKVKIYAPDGFLENAAKENVYVGNAMGRRNTYHIAVGLKAGTKGVVDAGLGKQGNGVSITLIPPTDVITENQTVNIDGLEVQFQLTPGTEAPSEMNTYLPKYRTLFGAENVTGTLHNLYSLRGTEVRDSLAWSKYIDETIMMWPDMEYAISSHNWPHFGNEDAISYLEMHRDVYRYLHNTTLNLLNKGYTIDEVGRMVEEMFPEELEKEWTIHGYYGSISHDAKAIAQKYLGYYDGNPSNLNKILPEEAAPKYVELMGGAEAVIQAAKEAFDNGEYAWAAELLNKVVFADPQNMDARYLCADALEQMAYQAESASWRNCYLKGASELRNGNPGATTSMASVDIINAMTLPMILDFTGIRFEGTKGVGLDLAFNVTLRDSGETAAVTVKNGVLNYRNGQTNENADFTIETTKILFNKLMTDKDITAEGVNITGDTVKLEEFLGFVTNFTQDFNIIEP